jgi:hypothetical protein
LGEEVALLNESITLPLGEGLGLEALADGSEGEFETMDTSLRCGH